jgi:hypothetical protein
MIMSLFLIRSPHTVDNCGKILDVQLSKGIDILDKFVWTCNEGDHTGYAMVEANDKDEALNKYVPDSLRHDVKIYEVHKYTPEQIRSLRTMTMAA